MLRQTLLLSLIAVLTACVQPTAAPASAPPPPAPATEVLLSLPRRSAPQAVSLHAGQTLVLKLESNRSTGYSWAMDSAPQPGLNQQGEPAYVADPHTAGIVGSGGTETWRFKALAAGDYPLQLVYHRPWIHASDPDDERLRMAVTVLGDTAP